MKKILMLVTLLSLFTLTPPAQAAHGGKHVFVTVNGLVCDVCAQSLKKIYMKNSAVADVKIDLDTKVVTLDLHANKNIDDKEIAKGINYAGYDLVKISRD